MKKIKLNGVTFDFPTKNTQHLMVTTPRNGIKVSMWMGDNLTLYDENRENEILIMYETKSIRVITDNMLTIERELINVEK